ncbi:MAG TPA: metal ABC transporter substrate-binding protein [Nocardioides sp.]|uniref:metal ABC transporter substrate-binding protein n=1 Tax=Nocardioides sp. TaxID=35761 RepID=UPI002E351654|nr:metal ABC transporter substrate-binding protein [Nocardioides sp.]HEX5088462.1 metal ABC transporter substrate-binding protein [Nocardioides sp.]
MRLLLVTALLVTTSGCAAFTNDAPDNADQGLEVVAAFYPLQFVAQQVAGDHADVVDLTKPGSEPHDLELSVAQTAEVLTADLVVYEKGLQAAVDAAVGQASGVRTIDAGAVAGLEPTSHDGHDNAEDGPSLGEEPSDLGDLDPHFWLDPLKLARVVDAVAGELAAADPEHADDFRANAQRLHSELTRLDQEYADGLRGCARDTVVVSHDAFGYLGRYGLHFEPISGLSPDAEPTPADLARLEQLVDEDGLTTVFSERLASPELAQSLADDLGVTTAVLDPIEGLSTETSGEDYLSLMRENLAALQEANRCPT